MLIQLSVKSLKQLTLKEIDRGRRTGSSLDGGRTGRTGGTYQLEQSNVPYCSFIDVDCTLCLLGQCTDWIHSA